MPKIKLLLNYPLAKIFTFISDRDEDLIEKFINSLQESEQKKIINAIEQYHKFGIIENKEIFKLLEDGIFEFKRDYIRILCYILPDQKFKSLVLLHGFKKKCQKTPKKELKKAKNRRDTIENLRKSNRLKLL